MSPTVIAPPAALDLREVVVDRDGASVVGPLSVAFDAGRVTALVGPNGSGKSTLLEALAGALPVAAGDAAGLAALRASRSIAFVPQHTAPTGIPVTVGELVGLGLVGTGISRTDARARVADALAGVDLAGAEGHALDRLSGGQRQRAFVAQAIVRRAGLVLLDEPTSSVDAASRDLILAAVRREAERGAIVVHATHDEGAVAAADDVLRLDRGRRVD